MNLDYDAIHEYIDRILRDSSLSDVLTNGAVSAVSPAAFSMMVPFFAAQPSDSDEDESDPMPELQNWLDKYLEKEPIFQRMLVQQLEKAGYAHSYPGFYKQAEIDRRLFSKMISETYVYHPEIKTVFKCIIGLQLDIEEAQKMLHAAAYDFGTKKFNLGIRYCLENKIYDHVKIDEILYDLCGDTLYSIA